MFPTFFRLCGCQKKNILRRNDPLAGALCHEADGSYRVHLSGAKVHVSFKQNSLLVTGVARMVEQKIRVIDVDVPPTWQNIK